MPFCVSSFASLIKGKGFLLVIPPTLTELATSLGACVAFIILVVVIKRVTCQAGAQQVAPADAKSGAAER